MMDPSRPPFTCTYTPEVAELLAALNCTLALSTYQAGKVILLSSTDGEKLHQLPRTFDVPMGLAYEDRRLAVATKHEIVTLVNDPRMASGYPNKPNWYDAVFLPRSAHYSGAIDTHDLLWTPNGLIGVNTLFSCLFRLDDYYSFVPIWKPSFITELVPEDRCHLNGMAAVNGKPRYVTAFGTTNTLQGWRPDKLKGGILMDISTNEILIRNLPMPHTPRVYDGELYLLLSASGEIVRANPEDGTYDVINRVSGFVRGMDRLGDYLFVGSSHLRKTHTFGDLPLAQEGATFCGIIIFHLPTGAMIGQIKYVNSCNEIYDVLAIPGIRRPNILNNTTPIFRRALSLQNITYWGKEHEETTPNTRSTPEQGGGGAEE
ncbi:MAG: TIGR03032 family protein [candidate division Zixibacteria bacterium]|nr:TIGR03032 family protein [candidate division Zixibacteria bacterium]